MSSSFNLHILWVSKKLRHTSAYFVFNPLSCPKCAYQNLSYLHSQPAKCLSTSSPRAQGDYRLPSEVYAERVRSKTIDEDKYQLEVIKAFDKLQAKIAKYKPPPRKSAMVQMFQGIFGGSSSTAGEATSEKSNLFY